MSQNTNTKEKTVLAGGGGGEITGLGLSRTRAHPVPAALPCSHSAPVTGEHGLM